MKVLLEEGFPTGAIQRIVSPAGLKDVIVGLGPSGQAVEEVIQSLPVTIVWNKDPDSDGYGHAGGLPEDSGILPARRYWRTNDGCKPVTSPCSQPDRARQNRWPRQ